MMAANVQVYQTTTVTNATLVTDAETIVATIPSVSVNSYGSVVRVDGMVNVTTAADTSALVFKLRRNTVTGTQVGATITCNAVPAHSFGFPISFIAAEPTGLHTYVLTASATDASANATVNAVVVVVEVGN